MPLAPDTQIRVSLIGTTERLAYARGNWDAAVVEVQRIAAGRSDLLAEAAGHFLGADTWIGPICHRLLIAAGADVALIEPAAKQTRWNLQNYGHTSEGTIAPR